MNWIKNVFRKKSVASISQVPKKQLQDILHSDRTYEICVEYINNNGLNLQYVPAQHKTIELCTMAIEQNENALCFVPNNVLTLRLCCIAVNKDLNLMQYSKKYNTELRYIFFGCNMHDINNLQITLKDKLEFCKLMIEYKGTKRLKYIPWDVVDTILDNLANEHIVSKYSNKYIDIGSYEKIVRDNGSKLQYVPVQFRTKDICLSAISDDCNAFKYVPMHLRSYPMCKNVVKYNGDLLFFVPTKNRDHILCYTAIYASAHFIRDYYYFLPNDMHEKMRIMQMLQENRFDIGPAHEDCLRVCRENINNDVMCSISDWIIEKHPESILNLVHAYNIHKKYEPKLIDMYKNIIKKKPDKFADVRKVTDELDLFGIQLDGTLLRYIKNPSIDICIEAVKQTTRALAYVPDEYRDTILNALE